MELNDLYAGTGSQLICGTRFVCLDKQRMYVLTGLFAGDNARSMAAKKLFAGSEKMIELML